MDCQLNCEKYIPNRLSENIPDLQNPFITHYKNPQRKLNTTKVYKVYKKKDDTMIILCFILFLLFAKLMYF